MRTHRKLGASQPLVLGIAGQFFTLNGQPWTAIECSDFSLYKFWLDGHDIRPILQERAAIGFNLLRVWLLNTSVIPGGLHPNKYHEFYKRLPDFAAYLASYGLCVEFTAFTQTQTLMPSVDSQQHHLHWTVESLRGVPNALLELVNEDDAHDNAVDPSLRDRKPEGVICSSGSNGADAPTCTPVWDYGSYHSNGLSEWQRKCAHNPMHDVADVHGIPAGAGENTRFPDQDSSEEHAEDAAAGAALLCALACFHSEQGKQSRLFSDTVTNSHGQSCGPVFRHAVAWVRGAESVPLEFQRGRYIHRTDLESTKACPSHTGDGCETCGGSGRVIDYDANPCYIRAYERRLPDGRGHALRIRK